MAPLAGVAMPAPVGIGLRAPHFRALAGERQPIDFLEAHAENFLGGGPAAAWLAHFRHDYPVSLHGVGLSLGGSDPLDEGHLARLRALVDRTEPWLVSEHLSWSRLDGRHFHDLLPMPFTHEAAAHVASRIQHVQERLARPLLVENVSAYHRFAHDAFDEAQFVCEVVARAGCRLLLDVNNAWVNANNFGFDAHAFIAAMPADAIGEIHLGGHVRAGALLVDTHGAAVCDAVWELYRFALERFGPRPTLIEWDTDIPALPVLLAEAGRARAAMAQCVEAVAA